MNSTKVISAGVIKSLSSCSSANLIIDLPSGVSSFNEVKTAFSVNSSKETPFTGRNFAAILLPNVIVPVLSKIIVSTSPLASTALPDIAITLKRVTLSIPAIPIADSKPPIVVGIKQTVKAMSVVTLNFT